MKKRRVFLKNGSTKCVSFSRFPSSDAYKQKRNNEWGLGSGSAMVLGKLPVPGRPANFDNSRARAYCAGSRCGWGSLSIFTLACLFTSGGGRVVRRCWVNF